MHLNPDHAPKTSPPAQKAQHLRYPAAAEYPGGLARRTPSVLRILRKLRNTNPHSPPHTGVTSMAKKPVDLQALSDELDVNLRELDLTLDKLIALTRSGDDMPAMLAERMQRALVCSARDALDTAAKLYTPIGLAHSRAAFAAATTVKP